MLTLTFAFIRLVCLFKLQSRSHSSYRQRHRMTVINNKRFEILEYSKGSVERRRELAKCDPELCSR
jgi:hypothetical protein